MKLTTVIKSILLTVLLVFLVYQSLNITKEQTASKPKENSETPEQEVQKEEAEDEVKKKVNTKELSEFPGLHIRTESEESNRYTMSMNIPFTKNAELDKPIEQWITEIKAPFLAEIENIEINETNIPHLNVQVKTVQIKENVYSLLFSASQYTGGANGIEFVKPFTLDLVNEKILTLNSIFPDALSADMAELIKQEVANNAKLAEAVDQEALNQQLTKMETLKWTINSLAFTVYFDEYEITPGSNGIIKVEIPLTKITGFLTEEIVTLLDITIETPEAEDDNKQEETPKPNDNRKFVALTFDDGPSAEVTPRVLESLKEYDAKATFFMIGTQTDYYPQLVQEVAAAGHEVANHSQTHPDLTKLSEQQVLTQLDSPKNSIEKAIGIRPNLFRPPYGATNNSVKAYAEKNNDIIVNWSVDTLDWQNKNPRTINEIVRRDVSSGAIILMHDIHATTADALPEMLAFLANEGYEFVTVSELLAITNQTGPGPIYGSRK